MQLRHFKYKYLCFVKAKGQFRFHSKGAKLVFEKDNADLSLLPPCHSSLELHIDRANYQTYIWKQSLSANPKLPSLTESGWKLENDQLEIKWGNEMFSSDLEKVLVQTTEDIDSDDETDNSQTNVSYDYSDSDEDSDEEFNLEF